MAPSNDFTRPAPARVTRRLVATLTIGVTLTAAGWALTQVDGGVWPAVGAASVFSMGGLAIDERPRYAGEQLERPHGYERWVAVGASLGLGYSTGSAPHEAFHQVFIAPSAFDAFVETGVFPEGTMLALEIAAIGSNVLPARTGRFADGREALEFAVKDKRQPGGWAYYSFGDGTRSTARPFPAADCASCHRTHAQSDNVFTQFYPRLRAQGRG